MNCANCSNKALYEYRITEKKSVFYCGKDLPKFLEARKVANLIPLTDAHNEELASALNTLSVKAEAAPEPTEPQVVKKAVKKQAK